MSAIAHELEQELAHELASEAHEASPPGGHQAAHEHHEQEGEHEAFFNTLAAMGDRSGRSQALRKIALVAAKAALRTQPPPPPGIEGEFELEAEAEFETAAKSPAQIDAMLEHLGHNAAEAANEQEAAEHFLPLIPLAAKLVAPLATKMLGKVAARVAPKLISKVAPTLTRAVANATRTVFRSPTARPLLHAMPRIARSTVAQLARRAAHGRPINPRIAVRTLARNTYRTLSNPRVLAHTYRRSLRADSRHHAQSRRLIGTTPRHLVHYGPGGTTPLRYGTGRYRPGYRRYYGRYSGPGSAPGPRRYYTTNGVPAPTPVNQWNRSTSGPRPSIPPGAVLTGISYQYSLPTR